MRLLINQVYDVLNENAKKIFNIELDSKYVQNSTKKEFGDFQTNFAMVNAKTLGKNPREIAPVSYTHLTLPTTARRCRSRWSPYH